MTSLYLGSMSMFVFASAVPLPTGEFVLSRFATVTRDYDNQTLPLVYSHVELENDINLGGQRRAEREENLEILVIRANCYPVYYSYQYIRGTLALPLE